MTILEIVSRVAIPHTILSHLVDAGWIEVIESHACVQGVDEGRRTFDGPYVDRSRLRDLTGSTESSGHHITLIRTGSPLYVRAVLSRMRREGSVLFFL